ncbi:phosphate ABC transporter substrate-binding protein [Mesoplasma florum]|uniref:phosphate ABC transporter substrate-binding protein n=1 Tax=Mesoplasma florum TaxID=2151 RepID=UPI000BE3236A|nr:phosphate ABC transporter substrate-binding protein [Mesoplasma florum]ATI73875.1 phosphate ABC transporter substrate-binding protein [Mesoplasma florum]AVN58841.1 phosphate ABC transporter substrate-binding protein [Mesoplasma florum]AVN64974.1 phosphate ABC transporter substrate-binding protein [Mesoplasma florum]
MNKKFFLVMVIVVGAIVGLWSWTLVAPNNSISIGGSASVQPLLKKLTDKYKTEDGKKFVYSATGSGAGVTNVQEGVYEIGFISKDISAKDWSSLPINENETLFKDLKEENINDKHWYSNTLASSQGTEETYRSIEFARDSIVFVYNDQGTGFDKFLEQSNLNFSFEVNDEGKFDQKDNAQGENINRSYKILNEIYNNDSQNDLITWNRLAILIAENFSEEGTKEQNIKLAQQVSSTAKVTPYSSTSGSGTRTSFTNLTGINPGNAVKEYGANGTIYSQIEKSPGSIGFVSMLYGSANSSRVKSVKIKQGDTTWDPSKDDSEKLSSYPLTRPFIAIYKYDTNNKDLNSILDFLFWMAASPEVKNLYSSVGLTQLVQPTK